METDTIEQLIGRKLTEYEKSIILASRQSGRVKLRRGYRGEKPKIIKLEGEPPPLRGRSCYMMFIDDMGFTEDVPFKKENT